MDLHSQFNFHIFIRLLLCCKFSYPFHSLPIPRLISVLCSTMDSVLVDPEFMKNLYKFKPELLSNFSMNPNGDIFQALHSENDPLQFLSFDEGTCLNSCTSQQVPDFPDACLKFISDILLEEGLDANPASAQALEATEKSLYDALGLGEPYPLSCDHFAPSISTSIESPDDSSSNKSYSSNPEIDGSYAIAEPSFESNPNCVLDQPQLNSFPALHEISRSLVELGSQASELSFDDAGSARVEKKGKSIKGSRRKKSRQREGEACYGGRSHKVQASFNDDYYEMEQYDDVVLLCNNELTGNSRFNTGKSSPEEGWRRLQRSRGKKQNSLAVEVDLMTLLTQCAQAVSSFDLRGANELLRQIRQNASPYGGSIQRLAHHVANALEARIAGTGSTVSTNLVDAKFSASDFLKAYRLYVSAVPYKRMSFFLANCSIAKLAEKATKIHIIDFGVFLGLQWPCFIQHLSKRPNGPPKLRITGIDYPQQGFRPAQRVEATGHRLSGYCERFGVPFSYQGIAQKWETIQPEDLKIEQDELVIVNCLFRSGTLLDETVEANSPRDAFLALVRKLNPSLFIHGVVNGTFNAPFFVTRFREALFHYSSVFDVSEETIPRDAHERFLIESEICGKELFNVVACEGAERVQRPETYKQWQVRTTRAGLRQVALDQELMKEATAMVKANYHKDFMVDINRHWMLQGWKGRTLCALSFWQPA